MPPFELPPQKDLVVNFMEPAPEMTGSLLDLADGTWLVKAPAAFSKGEVPEYIELAFGHDNFFWRVPAEVLAGYAPWLFVKAPDIDDARRFQRRSYVRIALSTRMVAIPITPSGSQRGPAVSLDIQNLSAGGCLALADGHLGRPGEQVVVAVTLPGLPTMATPSQLVRVSDNVHGIQFHGLKGQARDAVARYITDQIAHNLSRGRDITLPPPT